MCVAYDHCEFRPTSPPLSIVRMAERSKALRSGRSPLLWAWVRIPLLTIFLTANCIETNAMYFNYMPARHI